MNGFDSRQEFFTSFIRFQLVAGLAAGNHVLFGVPFGAVNAVETVPAENLTLLIGYTLPQLL